MFDKCPEKVKKCQQAKEYTTFEKEFLLDIKATVEAMEDVCPVAKKKSLCGHKEIRRANGPRACWRTSVLFLGYTPLPPSSAFGCQMSRAAGGPNSPRAPGDHFLPVFFEGVFYLISGSVFGPKKL